MKTLEKVTRRLKRTLGYRHVLRSDFCDQQEALIVHGLHKSASMFLFKFFQHVCDEIKVPFYSINLSPPNQNVPATNTNTSFVYCPERSFQTNTFKFVKLNQTHLFQTRDPRDILVSEYFSLGWRHSDHGWDEAARERRSKIQQLTIDQYVLSEPELSVQPLQTRYQPLLDQIGDSKTHMVKYETMVEDFPQWLAKVLPLMNLTAADDLTYLARLYRREFQREPGVSSHKRNVSAGDHVSKLKPETIAELNDRFAPVLLALQYPS